METPFRQIRALYDNETVTVYQAFSPRIAEPAVARNRFADGFNRERMTWIKPSLLWMMYRSGWAAKPGQERILAVRISRAGFAWALERAAFAHFDSAVHADRGQWRASLRSPVRVQWDPERDLRLRPLPYRSLQLGLSGEAVARYCDEWIAGISDVTESARRIAGELRGGDPAAARRLLPAQRPYPLAPEIAAVIGATG
jgi:hypothetical protein